jgi:hypothetical protein
MKTNNPKWTATLRLRDWQRVEELVKYAEPRIAREINKTMELTKEESLDALGGYTVLNTYQPISRNEEES